MRATLIVVLLAILVAIVVPRRGADAAADEARADVTALFDQALASENAYDLLASLCQAAPKRLSGMPGYDDACHWAQSTLEEAGADRVWLEPVEVPHWERGDFEELVLTAPESARGRSLRCTAIGGSVGTGDVGVEGPLVVVTSLDELEAKPPAELEGAVVLFARAMDRTRPTTFEAYGAAVGQRVRGAVEAARHGAAAALVRSMTTRTDDVPHTGALHYDDEVARIPAAAVSTRAADELVALAAGDLPVRVRLRLDCRELDPRPAANVLAELEGRLDPDQIVLVGAHLDAWDLGQGAHDDGAGCVHAIEALRLLAARAERPRRTVRVVLFANEENGLAGGRAYRRAHGGDRHVLAIESDSGGFVPRGFSTNANRAENPRAWTRLRDATAFLAPWGAGDLRPGGGGADIGPLADTGTVLCGLTTDSARYFDLHHTELDTLAAVHPRELSMGAGAVAALAFLFADAEKPLSANPTR